MKGYVLSFDDDLVFAPSSDSEYVVSAFHDRAFMIGTLQDRNDELFLALKKVGDSITVGSLDSTERTSQQMKIYYFYCEISLAIVINSNADFEVLNKPNYKILLNGKKHDFWGLWIQNKVLYLKPKKDMFRSKIKRYYSDKGHAVPTFLK